MNCSDFSVVPREPLLDNDLTLEAKGVLFGIIVYKQQGIDISAELMAQYCADSAEDIEKYMQELEEKGYLKRTTYIENGQSKTDFIVIDDPKGIFSQIQK